MAFRFFRRFKLAPGVSLNLSKSGGSLSFGPRGAKVTLGTSGARQTVGLPGTGLYYTKHSRITGGRVQRRGPKERQAPAPPPKDRLTLGFFQRLFAPAGEKAWVDAMRELVAGREDKARAMFEDARGVPDASFVAGLIALRRGEWERAAGLLERTHGGRRQLGQYFGRYGVSLAVDLQVTDGVHAVIGPDERGLLLAMTEAFQHGGAPEKAVDCLQRLRHMDPEDVMIKLFLAEFILDRDPDGRDACKRVVELAQGVKNESEVHGALLLHRARALRGLGLHEAARDTLTPLLRRRSGRPQDLLLAIRYERALTYTEMGHEGRARGDFERIYAESPSYEDVEARLGLA